MSNVAIIHYNTGNLASIYNALKTLGYNVYIIDKPGKIQNYDRIILPGVGAFEKAILYLEKSGIKEEIIKFIQSEKPLLGICLGMQLLFEKSYDFGGGR